MKHLVLFLLFLLMAVGCGEDGNDGANPVINPNIPENPICYTPCKGDLVLSDGTFIACSSEGLMPHCLTGTECIEGSCVPVGIEARAEKAIKVGSCKTDCECPDFQRCMDGMCYSECEKSSECSSGDRCYRKVCRTECSKNSPECSDGFYCNLEDNDRGVCMPLCETIFTQDSKSKMKTIFTLDRKVVSLSNTKVSTRVLIAHNSPFTETFTVKKIAHSSMNDEGIVSIVTESALSWIHVGVLGSESEDSEVEITIGAGETFELSIVDVGGDVSDRWNGKMTINHDRMGTQKVQLKYATLPSGQWGGKIYYFAQFGDENLDPWIANKGGDLAKDIGNAFMQKWAALRTGSIDYDEFSAVLSATINGSWDWASVREMCVDKKTPTSLCYLYTGDPIGISQYSSDGDSFPVPSGLSVLPITLNLKEDSNNSKVYTGKIVTGNTLHYPGDPSVTLSFERAPLDFDCIEGRDCLGFINGFSSDVYVGGRYTLKETGSCATNFKKVKTPWLVPGFMENVVVDDGLNYKIECKDQTLPLGTGFEDINALFSSANPIPDGKHRKREIRLVDGMLINQNIMMILIQEKIYLDVLDTVLTSYGLIQLTRSPATLESKDYVAKDVTLGTQFDEDVLNVSCSDEILKKYGTGLTEEEMDEDDYKVLAKTLLDGSAPGTAPSEITGSSTESVHYLCVDTGIFDGGHIQQLVDGTEEKVYCPVSSEVIYFTLKEKSDLSKEACHDDLSDHNNDGVYGSCNKNTLEQWSQNDIYSIRLNPFYKCDDENKVFCDDDRADLRNDKIFYEKALDVKLALPLRSAIANAFRYRVRFASRSGKTIGFAPEICQQSSDEIPYCYDPVEIEDIEGRVDCLLKIYRDKYDNVNFDSSTKSDIKNYLVENFAYVEYGANNEDKREGFERLNVELLVMMGDEGYTKAFASRFDLAGSGMKSFQGSLFEPGGIDLSGAAGYEMYNLYQAAQYYQKALDRFYRYSEVILESVSKGENDGNRNFITQGTAVSYFTKLIRASTQKTRAWSEVSKRYQNFNEPELARIVIKRAYSAAYMESVVLSNMMQNLLSVTDAEKKAQVAKMINDSQLIYKAAFIDMREVYDAITNDINYFGFSPEYMPFPALDDSGQSAFEKIYTAAEKKLEFAYKKEQAALSDNRSYETDAALFQAELIKIRNNYENELGDLCGYINVDSGTEEEKVYPAIPKYAYLHEDAKYLGNPCGYVGNGQIHQAMGEMEIALLNLQDALGGLDGNEEEMAIELERHNRVCNTMDKIAGIKLGLRIANTVVEDLLRVADSAAKSGEMLYNFTEGLADKSQCVVIAGTANGSDCATAAIAKVELTAGFAAYQIGNVLVDSAQKQLESIQDKVELGMVRWGSANECEFDQIDSEVTMKTLLSARGSLALEAIKAQYRVRLAVAKIQKLRGEATRMMVQQEEAEQLAINVEAARNDPNVRIYKNDAIINADRAFYSAVKEAYKATKVLEYYTSTSYEKLTNLFLIRMISYGDYNLENYLHELNEAFVEFEEEFGNPDDRVAIYSLKNDILNIPRVSDDGMAYSEDKRNQLLREKLTDGSLLDKNGYVVVPFKTGLDRLSPLTFSHKIKYLEAEIIGGNQGDYLGRIYIKQQGTSAVRPSEGSRLYYLFPERTAVVDTFFNGEKWDAATDIFKNDRFRDRPFVNTNYEMVLNVMDEHVNQDLKLNEISDIKLYFYYTDFTKY